ncbi:MAG: hypoxanthine phosphoribosyltransferase [Clostridia bacterium]|nr:hypoxanthine phosphoribosyltransferase [Clostridia bacterium]
MTIDTSEILISRDSIEVMVNRVANQINEVYNGEELIVVGILTGAFVFTGDLVRKLNMPTVLDFMQVSSYEGENSTGVLKIHKDLSVDIKDRNVLIVEDVIDTGYTLQCLKDMLEGLNPKSLRICVAFDKPERRINDLKPDFTGLVIPDRFIVGYGLDFDGAYRNLPDVCVVNFVEEDNGK